MLFLIFPLGEDSIIYCTPSPSPDHVGKCILLESPPYPYRLRMFAKCLMNDYGPTTLIRILRLGNKVCSVAGTSSSRGPCPPLPSLVQTGKSTLLEKKKGKRYERKKRKVPTLASQLVGFLVIRSSLFIPPCPPAPVHTLDIKSSSGTSVFVSFFLFLLLRLRTNDLLFRAFLKIDLCSKLFYPRK